MVEDPIKESFKRVKEDIQNLRDLVLTLSKEINSLKQINISANNQATNQTDKPTDRQTDKQNNTTECDFSQTIHQNKTENTTDNYPLEAVRSKNIDISTGNDGVTTNRQTDRQTDTSTGNKGVQDEKFAQVAENGQNKISSKSKEYLELSSKKGKMDSIDYLDEVAEVLNSLDSIKKDLRTTFKKLTGQEMVVFSTIYQLEEQGFTIDYNLVARKLSLTES